MNAEASEVVVSMCGSSQWLVGMAVATKTEMPQAKTKGQICPWAYLRLKKSEVIDPSIGCATSCERQVTHLWFQSFWEFEGVVAEDQ